METDPTYSYAPNHHPRHLINRSVITQFIRHRAFVCIHWSSQEEIFRLESSLLKRAAASGWPHLLRAFMRGLNEQSLYTLL